MTVIGTLRSRSDDFTQGTRKDDGFSCNTVLVSVAFGLLRPSWKVKLRPRTLVLVFPYVQAHHLISRGIGFAMFEHLSRIGTESSTSRKHVYPQHA